jgi:hypothetical protein
MDESELGHEHLSILAVTADDNRYAPCVAEALRLALPDNAHVVLYDIDAASFWSAPLSNISLQRSEKALSPSELRRNGRAVIAEQVEAFREHGLKAWGWLPADKKADSLVDYAREVNAQRIVIPRELETPSFAQRLQHLGANGVRDAAGADIEVIAIDCDEK